MELVINIELGGESCCIGGNDTDGTLGQYVFGLGLTCWLLVPLECFLFGGSSSSDNVRSMTSEGRFLPFGVTVLVEWLPPALLVDAESAGIDENMLGTADSSLTFDERGIIIKSLSES